MEVNASHIAEDARIRQLLADMALFPEMNPGPVIRMDRNATIVLANNAAKDLFEGEELTGRSWIALCPGMTQKLWEQIVASKKVFPFETEVGDSYMVFKHVCPGNQEHVFAYGTDITANKLAEKQIAEIARFPDMNPGPVLRLDLAGKVLLSNAAASNVFGEDLLGQNWIKISEMAQAFWEQVLKSTEVVPFEVHAGEKYFVFNHRRDFKTDLVFVFGADITLNKLAEKQIAEVARFPDMNPGPVLRLDLDGKILLSNAAATNVFGEDLVGRNWRQTLPPMTDPLWKEILNATSVVPVEARIGDKDFVFNHRRDFKTDLVFVFGADISLQKAAERSLRQSEKMATLGTLAAGVAHELNNPAAATRRAALQLRDIFTALEKAHADLNTFELTNQHREMMDSLSKEAQEAAIRQSDLDALTRSDLEAEVEEWLDEQDVDEPWNLAPNLVRIGLDRKKLEDLAPKYDEDILQAIIKWVAALFPVYSLLHEISEGSSRISEIVVALKNYSFLGQAPIQQVNIHEGIDNTLVILRNKMKVGITVHRQYSPDLPGIVAYGSELNQVWTNILDNAADALKGRGNITIRTRKEGAWAVIEIEDDGPGIPEAVQSQIFDPFFTTKEPGKGTGLGLSTTYGIITEKHKGTINVASRPGMTRFTVRLPIDQPRTAAAETNV